MAIVYVTYRWNRVDNTFAIIYYGLLLTLAGDTLVIQNGNIFRRMGKYCTSTNLWWHPHI
jgi:hypothetical protein